MVIVHHLVHVSSILYLPNVVPVVFRGRGDDSRENNFIGVQTRALPRCIYDVFIYQMSVELRKKNERAEKKTKNFSLLGFQQHLWTPEDPDQFHEWVFHRPERIDVNFETILHLQAPGA